MEILSKFVLNNKHTKLVQEFLTCSLFYLAKLLHKLCIAAERTVNNFSYLTNRIACTVCNFCHAHDDDDDGEFSAVSTRYELTMIKLPLQTK